MTGFLPRSAAYSSPPVPLPVPEGAPSPSFAFLRRSATTDDAPAAPDQLPLAVSEIDSSDTFRAVSTDAGDLVANGRAAKFLIDRRNPIAPSARFVNGNFVRNGVVPDEAKFHYPFGRATFRIPESLDIFNAVTYFTVDKRYIAGSVRTYHLDGASDPVYGLQFYPQDLIREHAVVEAVTTIRARLGITDARFAFVPTGSQQTTDTVMDQLASLQVEVLPLDRILGAIQYLPLNLGEAWGYLRIFPDDTDALTATDIPVFDELPLDLSVVAGVLTRSVQDTNSHVNLKSKERGTPNAVLRDAGPGNERLAPFADRPVHLVVGKNDFTIEATTPEVVAAKLAERMGRPLTRLQWTPETDLRSFDEIAMGTTPQTRAFAARYGSKAANLGFLAHRDVLGRVGDAGSPSAQRGYDLVPRGFAVPLQAYQEFIEHPPNADVRELIDSFVAAEQTGGLSPQERGRRVDDIQSGIMAASFPPGALERVRAKIDEVIPGVEKVKVRSSANAEDVPDFDGAGLHDSYAADTTKRDRPIGPCMVEEDDGDDGEVKRKVKPKSVGCAIKGVYASLWNKRAVEERSFARIDQGTIAMGIAIVPAYDTGSDVAANAVVVTRVLNTDGVYGYSLSVQQGNNLVTNPDPATYSEVTIAAFISDDEPTSLTVTRFAKPAADAPERTEPVLSSDRMLELVDLARRVERAYCRATPGYYPDCDFSPAANDKATALDLELKILDDGHLVYKQVREFGGR
ncbi:PEP/pyruvate-binding domain-containing protein [Microbacterium pumilum]|uniref:Pyruvate phosphate dikinase AMP/ATP-binding domain-containing protein n=1 Tax=Microbacterium pumilum TaxID=344165 RepID=A0ABN2T0S9_9MICO